jgi:hypothetical protein
MLAFLLRQQRSQHAQPKRLSSVSRARGRSTRPLPGEALLTPLFSHPRCRTPIGAARRADTLARPGFTDTDSPGGPERGCRNAAQSVATPGF